MKYVDEFRQADAVHALAKKIADITTRPWTLMEICGGQTHAIVKYGLQQLVPEQITLIHGPGCPVCVTPIGVIDQALELASQPGLIFCSFGDMLRVPGSDSDLLSVKTRGGDVRIVYSPLDAVRLAEQNPDREVVFLAIGFETTTAANAMAVYQASQKHLTNFSMLTSQFQVPPAIESLCSSPQCRVQGFLAAGHVCTVMGYRQYFPLAEKFHIPILVTGFEPVDILDGILGAVEQLEKGQARVENRYSRAVSEAGNLAAQGLIGQVFETSAQNWRGIGKIENSGFRLRDAFNQFDAAIKFSHQLKQPQVIWLEDTRGCISGQIMQGLKKPCDCPHFGTDCHPGSPLGAPMVSAEGACAAYYQFAQKETA